METTTSFAININGGRGTGGLCGECYHMSGDGKKIKWYQGHMFSIVVDYLLETMDHVHGYG